MASKYLITVAKDLTKRERPQIVPAYELTVSYSIKYPIAKTDADLMQLLGMPKKSGCIKFRQRHIVWTCNLAECKKAKTKIKAYSTLRKMLITADYRRIK